MKKHSLKAAMKISKVPVPQKIAKAILFTDSILNNPAVFVNANPSIADVQAAIADLKFAWQEAEDGGKTKTAIMHDKEDDLLKILNDLAHYVESVANGNADIVHLAGMETKRNPVFPGSDFEVTRTDRGAVKLRVKPKRKTAYKWEYCKDPADKNAWTIFKITVQSTISFKNLEEGVKYWFRVIYTNINGETMPFEPISIIVV